MIIKSERKQVEALIRGFEERRLINSKEKFPEGAVPISTGKVYSQKYTAPGSVYSWSLFLHVGERSQVCIHCLVNSNSLRVTSEARRNARTKRRLEPSEFEMKVCEALASKIYTVLQEKETI